MTKEFKKIINATEIRYVLEDASAGATSAGNVASVETPIGSMQRRLQELKDKVTVPTVKPRNPAGMGASPGRGTKVHQPNKRQQARDEKKIGESEDDFRKRERSFGVEHETNNIQVVINGRPWKIFPGKGRADSAEEFRNLQSMRDWAKSKSAATGKKWEVYLTGATPTVEGAGEGNKPDHEISMASSELQSITKDAARLLDMIRQKSEEEGLEAWQQSKITKAADFMNSVLQSLSGDEQGVAEAEAIKGPWPSSAGEPNKKFNKGDRVSHNNVKGVITGIWKNSYIVVLPSGELDVWPMADVKSVSIKQGVAEGSTSKEKQKTPYRDINSPEYRATADKQKQQMAKDKASEPGKKLLGKIEKKDVAEGEKTMSRAAKGNEKYGKDGMKALAKAGRDGASEKKLDSIRDKHDNYNEGLKDPKDNPCWKGYKPVGTKKKGGNTVPNCVPKEGVAAGEVIKGPWPSSVGEPNKKFNKGDRVSHNNVKGVITGIWKNSYIVVLPSGELDVWPMADVKSVSIKQGVAEGSQYQKKKGSGRLTGSETKPSDEAGKLSISDKLAQLKADREKDKKAKDAEKIGKQGVAESEHSQRQKMITLISKAKGWDRSDLELMSTKELADMIKELQTTARTESKIKDADLYLESLATKLEELKKK